MLHVFLAQVDTCIKLPSSAIHLEVKYKGEKSEALNARAA